MNCREKIRKTIECPQFGNEKYGKWGALRIEQRVLIKRLLNELDNADNYVKRLYEENEELKKQLNKANDELYTSKNKYNIRLLNQISENIEPDCEDYYLAEIETKANKYDLIQTQQQEFIKYLEDKIERKSLNATCMFEYNDTVLPLKEILQKYKEIIGVSDEY